MVILRDLRDRSCHIFLVFSHYFSSQENSLLLYSIQKLFSSHSQIVVGQLQIYLLEKNTQEAS